MGSLILSEELVLSGTTLKDVLQSYTLDISSVSVLTNAKAFTSTAWKASEFNTVVSLACTAQHHSEQFIRWLKTLVQPGGKLILRQAADATAQAALRRDLLLSGLSPVDSQSRAAEVSSTVAVEAVKPKWQPGASQPIKLRKIGAASAVPSVKAALVKLWGGALEMDDDELVDDDELLTEEDLQRPAVPKADDCGAGKKACKNCVCGRAEEEAAGETRAVQKLTVEMLENPGAVGGCGSCSLGDAFRCGTCPYRGLPSFEPGKKISLGADWLAVDA